MKRRAFLTISATSLAGLAFGNRLSSFSESNLEKKYSIVLLGDTHFDTEPASVYHADYNEPVEWLNRVQRAEFARNGGDVAGALPFVTKTGCPTDWF